jgi:hypothetical protein
MHIAATLVRASSRLTLETECRFKIAERSPGAVIDQMPRQRTQMASSDDRKAEYSVCGTTVDPR